MKIQTRRIEAFLDAPDRGVRVVLIFGPDRGLRQERAERLGKAAVGDLADPFAVTSLTADGVAEDPASLLDGAAAAPLTGGTRLVWVRDADDRLAEPVRRLIAAPPAGSLTVLVAGDLSPRSKLRQACEGAAGAAAAVPCYIADSEDTARLVRDGLKAEGVGIDRDALALVGSYVQGDRQLARRAVEKLALYAGAGGAIDLAAARACIGDAAAVAVDELCDAVGTGDAATADRLLQRLAADGFSPVQVVRGLQNHFARLHAGRLEVDAGKSADQVVGNLKPPVFFKRKPAVQRQLSKWSAAGLLRALELLGRTESRLKSTGPPDWASLGEAVLALAGKR